MALYNKYRPLSFDELKGNKQIIKPLRKLIEKRETQVFLFHGPTGTGKTTLARIVAKELGCSENNIYEVNTAQFRGIDTVREIIQKIQYATLGGGARTYIIDEVHKMTTDAQNAFLKSLEDTPKDVFFILCTTNPQSLLPTVKSRCSIYQTKVLSSADMEDLLFEVAEREGVDSLDEKVIRQIIIDSEGHPRHALTILEQVLVVPAKERLKVAKRSSVEQAQSIELCRALMQRKSWKAVSTILTGLKDQDPESIRRVVLGYATTVLLKELKHEAYVILECFEEPTYNMGFPGIVLSCVRVINYDEEEG